MRWEPCSRACGSSHKFEVRGLQRPSQWHNVLALLEGQRWIFSTRCISSCVLFLHEVVDKDYLVWKKIGEDVRRGGPGTSLTLG